jgi:hypothetical protein
MMLIELENARAYQPIFDYLTDAPGGVVFSANIVYHYMR